MALGLGAAVLMNSALPARPVFRGILILPMAVSGVATALMGVLIFDENSGVLDGMLQTIGLPASPGSPAERRPSRPWCSSPCGGAPASTC